MFIRRSFLIGAAALIASVPAFALTSAPFEKAAFDAARETGKPVLVEVSADWCPTCKRQKSVLAQLGTKPEFKDFARFDVNFDTQESVWKPMNVRSQSTLIVYRGGKEVARAVGVTSEADIEALLRKAL